MATISTQAAPATAAAVIGSGTASHTSESVVGSHIFRIDAFSATKDLGVGKCIKSSTFRVGGHGWYVECYPCGDVEDSAGWVSLYLCRQEEHPGCGVSGYCEFTLMEALEDSRFKKLIRDEDEREVVATDFIELESFLMDDSFHVRCTVCIEKLLAVPLPHRATETMAASSHVLTVHGYSKIRRKFVIGQTIKSSIFHVGGHRWYVEFYPSGKDENNDDRVTVSLCKCDTVSDDEVKVRFEMTLLSHTGQIISSIQDFCSFSDINYEYNCKFLTRMEHESSPLLQDGIQIRCDVAIVKDITAVQPPPERPDLHGYFGELLTSQLGSDVTFEVGGDLFPAHKCVLATRSTVFMAEFFGTGKENAGVTQVLRIDDMEPMVFKALLRFIYTEDLPEVREEDKVVMAQGLLVAVDRYAMERLKMICADMLCSYVDATTAVATLELAEKHGCLKLKQACIEVIRDWLAKVTP